MSALDRFYWLAVAVVAYAAVAGMQGAGGIQGTGGALRGLTIAAVTPLVLWGVWRWAHRRERQATAGLDVRALWALKLAAAASCLWVTARWVSTPVPALELLATLAAGMAGTAGVYSLSRMPAARGLLSPPRSAHSIDATAFTGFLWGVALVVAGSRFMAPESPRLDPLTLDYASTAASIGNLLVLIAAAFRARFSRKVELGVGDRAAGALALSITALAVAIPTAAANLAPPDRVLPVALLVASLCTIGSVVIEDARHVSAGLRGTVALMVLFVPAALLTGAAARATPESAPHIALIGCGISVVIGLIVRAAARPLGPEHSRWLNAIERATLAALFPEPRQAIAQTLRALKAIATSPDAQPQLWRVEPASVLSVNVAGDLAEKDAEAPAELYELGLLEPELTLRAEVLRAVQVRKPAVRPLLAWFEVRNVFSATLIVDDGGVLGCLVLPRGGRADVMTLEEARAARILAERISALLSITSALARAQRRQLEAARDAEHWEDEYRRAQTALDGQGARTSAFVKNLARPLLQAAYSSAVRLQLRELERLASSEVLVLVAPVGVAVEAWAAAAHLARGARADEGDHAGEQGCGPLLLLDGGASNDGELGAAPERSPIAPSSPIALCEGGTLFIRDAELLSQAFQEHLLEGLTRRWEARTETGVRPPRLIVGLRRHPAVLAREGLLKALQPWFSKAVVELPTLVERPEDLRAMIIETLSRTGVGPEHKPLGVERAALQALLDYPWPGNEAELWDVLGRAAALTTGPLVTLSDLRAIGFAGLEFTAAAQAPWARDERRVSEPIALATLAGESPSRRPRARAPRTRRRRPQ